MLRARANKNFTLFFLCKENFVWLFHANINFCVFFCGIMCIIIFYPISTNFQGNFLLYLNLNSVSWIHAAIFMRGNWLWLFACSCNNAENGRTRHRGCNEEGQGGCNQWRSQPKNLRGVKKIGGAIICDFRRITLFCWENRLSKQNTTIFSKNVGGHGPSAPPWLRLWMQFPGAEYYGCAKSVQGAPNSCRGADNS